VCGSGRTFTLEFLYIRGEREKLPFCERLDLRLFYLFFSLASVRNAFYSMVLAACYTISYFRSGEKFFDSI